VFGCGSHNLQIGGMRVIRLSDQGETAAYTCFDLTREAFGLATPSWREALEFYSIAGRK
jgi:hypothetical protein